MIVAIVIVAVLVAVVLGVVAFRVARRPRAAPSAPGEPAAVATKAPPAPAEPAVAEPAVEEPVLQAPAPAEAVDEGVEKTTTIGKLAAVQAHEGRRVLLAAADTFRAAAADQLQLWAERAGGELVRGQDGADPGSVLFNAMAAASGRHADLVLVDTAG